MIKISTVIPVYNAEAFLERCLDSVLQQNISETEIICIDDGSTDNSLNILQDYEKRYDNVSVISQKNMHAGIARNQGIIKARGEYIHFLDADDYLISDIYQNVYQFAKTGDYDYVKIRAKSFSLLTGGEMKNEYFSMDYLDNSIYGTPVSIKNRSDELIKYSYRAPWGGIYKRKYLIDNHILFNDLPCIEDREFYIKVIINTEKIAYYNAFGVWHQLDNPLSIMGKSLEHFEAYIESYQLIREATLGINLCSRRNILGKELKVLLYICQQLTEEHRKQYYDVLKKFFKELDWNEVEHDVYPEMEKINEFLFPELKIVKPYVDNLVDMLKNFKTIYLYGIGDIGKCMFTYFKRKGLNIEFALVSKNERGIYKWNGLLVYETLDIKKPLDKDAVVFISTKSNYHIQIAGEISRLGCTNVYSLHDDDFECIRYRITRKNFEDYSGQYILSKEWIFPFSEVRKDSKILLYGAGDVGQAYYRQISITGYCEIVFWVDANYEQYQRNGLPVVSLNRICDKKFDYVVIGVADMHTAKAINKSLLQKGVPQEAVVWIGEERVTLHNNIIEDRILYPSLERARDILKRQKINFESTEAKLFTHKIKRMVSNEDMLCIPRIVVEMTTVCTMRCKKCNNLMPCYDKPSHVPLNEVINDVRRVIESADLILTMELLGGEPFTYPYLTDVLDLVFNEEKVIEVEITTNGTLLPTEKVLGKLKNPKLTVKISGYGAANQNKLEKLLTEKEIRYEVLENIEWIDSGGTEKRIKNLEKQLNDYRSCISALYCTTLYKGKIFQCARSASLYDLEICKNDNGYIDLKNSQCLKEDIKKFFLSQRNPGCNYCDYAEKWRKIPAGE